MTDGAPTNAAAGAASQSRVLTGRMPDLTAAQLVGVVGAVVAVAVSFGVHIAKEQQEAILALAAAVGAILFAADAHVRANRAHADAVKHLSDQHTAAVKHVADQHLEATKAAVAAGQPPPPLTPPVPPVLPQP
jgi:hypothetical protein